MRFGQTIESLVVRHLLTFRFAVLPAHMRPRMARALTITAIRSFQYVRHLLLVVHLVNICKS